VPTSLNVGGIDLGNRDAFLGPAAEGEGAAKLMQAYVELGCTPTFTCAPYQLPGRPGLSDHVAWAESNAIVFANSVLGARTNRYGDFLDISAAVTGRVPNAGLHLDSNRAATKIFRVASDVESSVDGRLLAALLGHVVGQETGTHIPIIDGLDPETIDEDWLQTFGAAGASSGGVAMFHVTGVTPEAPDLFTATHGRAAVEEPVVTIDDLRGARRELCTVNADADFGGVSLGTPHMSEPRLREVVRYLGGRRVVVPTYVSTSRSVLARVPDLHEAIQASGIHVVNDTCTYFSRIMDPQGAVMTDSAKWAYYAPANLGFEVMLATWRECIDSAVAGQMLLEAGSNV
jgi:predicted aconitase